jgi:tetratricopeptide (TPR) repeat protein
VSPYFASAQLLKGNDALMAQADTLLSQQDYPAAIAIYNKITATSETLSDENYSLFYKRAYCYYALEQYDNALKDVNQYLQKKPEDQAKLLRAYINQELGNHEEQLADLNAFIEASPGNVELLQWRASVLMELERYADAQKDIRQLLKSQPGPELKGYLGLTYYYLNDPDSALIVFDEVIASDPDYIQPYLYAGSLALDEEAYDLALQYINGGLKKDPSNNTLLFYKGIALVESERIDEGCRCLTKVFKAGFDDAADYLKGYCYGVD